MKFGHGLTIHSWHPITRENVKVYEIECCSSMEYNCNHCGALKFSRTSVLSNHPLSIFFFIPRNLEHTCCWVKSTSPQALELAQGLQQKNLQQEDPFDFDSLVSIPDDLDPPPYDSTFFLVSWIKHCRTIVGLSSKDIHYLFKKLLFRPSFQF